MSRGGSGRRWRPSAATADLLEVAMSNSPESGFDRCGLEHRFTAGEDAGDGGSGGGSHATTATAASGGASGTPLWVKHVQNYPGGISGGVRARLQAGGAA